jgi:hypothetical protein
MSFQFRLCMQDFLHGWYFVFRCLVLVLVLVLVSFVWLAFLLRLPGLPRGPQHPTQWRLEQPAMNPAAHAQHVHFPIQRQMAQREARQFFLTKFKSQQITFARFHSPPSDQLTDTFSDLLTLHKDHCLFLLVTLLAHIELYKERQKLLTIPQCSTAAARRIQWGSRSI